MKSLKNSLIFFFVLAFVFAFSYGWPRALAVVFGENSIWTSFLYTYGMGFLFCFLSVLWIFARPVKEPMRRKEEIRWLIILLCGLTFIFSIHFFWIFLAGLFPVPS